MAELTTTKMSLKGQVVIPEEIRKRLGLEAGTQFVVVADKDTVIMKAISPPSMDEFATLSRRQKAGEKGRLEERRYPGLIKPHRPPFILTPCPAQGSGSPSGQRWVGLRDG